MEDIVDIQKYLPELYPERPAFCAVQNDAVLRLRSANDANLTRGLVNGEKFATATAGLNRFEADPDVAQAVKATAVA
jgi:hypothetical protein